MGQRRSECVADAEGGDEGVHLVVGGECAGGGEAEHAGQGGILIGRDFVYEVVVLAGGVLYAAAVHIHEGEIDRQVVDGSERQSHRRLDACLAGRLGVVEILVAGA